MSSVQVVVYPERNSKGVAGRNKWQLPESAITADARRRRKWLITEKGKEYLQKRKIAGYNKKYNDAHREDARIRTVAYRLRFKIECFTHYSNGPNPFCACCGESDIGVLCLDHINGGGNRHRREIAKYFTITLARNTFPDTLTSSPFD